MATTTRKTLKAVFILATTMAMLMAAFTINTNYQKTQTDHDQGKIIIPDDVNPEHNLEHSTNNQVLLPSKRVSRFLAETTNNQHHHGRSLKPADHCNKDYEICYLEYGVNATCCGNKCFDINTDKHNCGACHNKCKWTNSCCNGKCVDVAFDKRNCGGCNNKCNSKPGQYCIYGMCDYA